MDKCSWCTLSAEERKWMLMQTTNWTVYMADEQDYIGRCILVLNRHCGCLSELTDSEWMDLKHLIDSLERCFRAVLGAELCNWSCLLNSFYKSSSPNPHLHLHVRPRYKEPVSINGIQYVDEEFGHHYMLGKENKLGEKEFKEIFDVLKRGLNICNVCYNFEEST
ncbi:MAG: HIT family protein [Clostridiales bacterium]|nr:HIT family protein [Clostridiales bacterium]